MNNPLVQVDPGLFIWTIATFLVLLTLLAKFAWGPLLQALAAREETIRKSLADAEKARQELERLNQESDAIIRQARVDAEGIIASTRTDAERLRGELREKARAEADGMIKNAERQIRSRPRARSSRFATRRRSLGGHRVEADSEEHHEGRQRAADRGCAEAIDVVSGFSRTYCFRSAAALCPSAEAASSATTRVRCREAVARSPAALASAASFISGRVHTISAAEAFWYQLCASAAFPCASLSIPIASSAFASAASLFSASWYAASASAYDFFARSELPICTFTIDSAGARALISRYAAIA